MLTSERLLSEIAKQCGVTNNQAALPLPSRMTYP